VENELIRLGVLKSGDQYIITSGRRMRESGSTNTLQVIQAE
jgi:pyruvate kinase, alpha/beta domain protein